MIDLKFKQYTFKLERNKKDGTKIQIPTDNLTIREEMVFLDLLDKVVSKGDLEDANKLIDYIKRKE